MIRIEPTLIETVVNAALEANEKTADAWLGRAYHALADPLYDQTAPDEREVAFDAVYTNLFDQLGLFKLMRDTHAEFPELIARAPDLLVLSALRASDEGAVIGQDGQSVCLRVRPTRFAHPAKLAAFIRHELLHAYDMLDETFGYEIAHEPSHTLANQLAERYHALWCTYVDARLMRRKSEPFANADSHRPDFYNHFATMTVLECNALFDQIWTTGKLTHADMLTLARAKGTSTAKSKPLPGSLCPLCKFPTFIWVTDISPAVAELIRADFPAWQIEQGGCDRCIECYDLLHSTPLSIGVNV